MRTLILDNYDSFTYNLIQYLDELGGNSVVYRNDRLDVDELPRLGISHVIISPGPGNPYTRRDIGVSDLLLGYCIDQRLPFLGVCLGHQVLARFFGAEVVRAPEVYHGKASLVRLEPGCPLFTGLPAEIQAMRYHSLCVTSESLPEQLRLVGRSDDGVVMAVQHCELPLFGVQFHPESIGTPDGKHLIRNFLALADARLTERQRLVVVRTPVGRKPSLLASRETRERTEVAIRADCVIGARRQVVIIAGPCAVESAAQIDETAAAVKALGVKILRGGAFKPRTGPYCFQGLGKEGLRLLRAAADRYGLATISEAMCPEQVALVEEYCDIVQIGARNMQNYDLLRRAGRSSRPILLKRGFSATLDELLLAAEHILANGNDRVMLCERGIRTFEDEVRFTLALGAIPPLRRMTHLPILVDPSHAAGDADFVVDYARAAVAVGADGLIIETHVRPAEAVVDGGQSLDPRRLGTCLRDLAGIAEVMNRTVV